MQVSSRTVTLNGGKVHVTGITKGSGMIHPNMATMLSVIATDANVEPATLRQMLIGAVDSTHYYPPFYFLFQIKFFSPCNVESFHCITVDGDSSTNDTVAAMASGAAKHAKVSKPIFLFFQFLFMVLFCYSNIHPRKSGDQEHLSGGVQGAFRGVHGCRHRPRQAHRL